MLSAKNTSSFPMLYKPSSITIHTHILKPSYNTHTTSQRLLTDVLMFYLIHHSQFLTHNILSTNTHTFQIINHHHDIPVINVINAYIYPQRSLRFLPYRPAPWALSYLQTVLPILQTCSYCCYVFLIVVLKKEEQSKGKSTE